MPDHSWQFDGKNFMGFYELERITVWKLDCYSGGIMRIGVLKVEPIFLGRKGKHRQIYHEAEADMGLSLGLGLLGA